MILRQQIIDKYNCRCYNDNLFVEVFNSQKPFARFFCVVLYRGIEQVVARQFP